MLLLEQTFLFNLDAQLIFDTILLAVAVFFLFLLMSYLLFNPARKLLSDRQNRIASEIEEAKEEASRIIKRAQEEAELEKKHAMDDVKQEMITIASMMAKKVVTASMDVQIQSSLVDETLREMGESTWLS